MEIIKISFPSRWIVYRASRSTSHTSNNLSSYSSCNLFLISFLISFPNNSTNSSARSTR